MTDAVDWILMFLLFAYLFLGGRLLENRIQKLRRQMSFISEHKIEMQRLGARINELEVLVNKCRSRIARQENELTELKRNQVS